MLHLYFTLALLIVLIAIASTRRVRHHRRDAHPGQILIVGGETRNENDEPVNTETVEVFDVWQKGFNQQESVPPLPAVRRNFGVAAIRNTLCVIGGREPETHLAVNTSECINLDEKPMTWKTIKPMPTKRQALAAAALLTKIFASGGHNGTHYLNTLEAFESTDGKWSTLTGMRTPRREHAVVALEQSLYAIGGFDDSVLSSVETYSIDDGEWSTVTPMRSARAAPCAAELNGKIYVMGGWNGRFYKSAEVYDPAVDRCSRIAYMNVPRKACGAAASLGFIYVFGGYGPDYLDSVEVYNATSDTWQMLDVTMDMPRGYPGVVALYN